MLTDDLLSMEYGGYELALLETAMRVESLAVLCKLQELKKVLEGTIVAIAYESPPELHDMLAGLIFVDVNGAEVGVFEVLDKLDIPVPEIRCVSHLNDWFNDFR